MSNTSSRLQVSIREGSRAASLNISEASLPGDLFDFRTLEGVLDGDKDFGLFAVHLTASDWRVNNNSYSYRWSYATGIVVDFLAVNEWDRLALTYTVTNYGSSALERVHIHPCLPTTEAPSFRPEKDARSFDDAPVTFYDRRERRRLPCAETYFALYDRIKVWRDETAMRFSETAKGRSEVHLAIMKQGEPPINWAWWNNTPEYFDDPIIVVESKAGDAVVALGFERAIWASANVGDNRACFHLFPSFGRIEVGQSSTTSGALYLGRGTTEEVRARFLEEFPQAARGRGN